MKPFLSFVLFLLCTNILSSQSIELKEPRCKIIRTDLILNQSRFAQCHASTLVELLDGSIMVAMFGGSYESAPDVKIWGTTLRNGHWSDPIILADGKVSDTLYYPCWNPVLFKSADGQLYLFYKVGKNPREWFGMMKTSSDQGTNWSAPIRLPTGIHGPIKNKPVELADHKLLCPSSIETSTRWSVQMEIMDLSSNEWARVSVDSGSAFEVIQPTILVHSPTQYQILCRSRQNVIVSSISADSGLSWTNFDSIPLPNPNSGIDGITASDGSYWLVYNPLLSGREWYNGRNRLNLARSADGINWKDVLILEDHPDGEFSYPAIIQSADGNIHITYTYNRINIKHVEIRNFNL